MRFGLKKQQPPPPPAVTDEDDVYDGQYTDEESSYGPVPPPPPPSDDLPADAIVAQKQVEYDEETAELQKMPTKSDPPPQDTTQDITQDDEDDDGDEEDDDEDDNHDYQDKEDTVEDDYDEPEMEDDDDAESVEIPPTTVVQRMLAQESEAYKEKNSASSSLRRAGTMMTCCLLILAIVLGVGFGTGTFTQESPNAVSGSRSGDISGVNGTSSGGRAADIQLFLASISVTPESLQSTSAAEAKAMNWLIAEDPLSLNTQSANDQFRLRQRYALLAFYYGSTKKWADETGWLVLSDECEWLGVTCESKQIDGTTVNAVTALEIRSNAINSNIPPDFVLLESIEILDLSDNEMEQDLSTFSWKSMISLLVLRLDSNSFSGDIGIFTELPVQLKVLSIGDNAFTGTIPDGISALVALNELNIESNELSGPISDVVSDLNITILRIGENNFDAASFPVFIYTMTQLEVLGLGATNINSPIEGALGSLVGLRVLDIYGNQLNGTIPSTVLAMSSLEEFNAHDCQLTGTFPDLSSWTAMKTLRLSDNEFTGSIPDTLNSLSNLLSLRLDGNKLTGSIPTTLTALQNLEILNLSKNPMSGVLPTDLGALFSLRELRLNSMLHPDFPRAGIIGTIPTSLGNLARLEILELRANFLDGEIPTTFGGLDAIQTLDLQHNQLSGQIPEVVGDWSDTITFVQFSNNQFTGSVPASICGSSLETLVADCEVSCTCCTSTTCA
jgi:Leucine-rich repeat (LRR) protein